jgi:protoporphyrinogen IX oxidase
MSQPGLLYLSIKSIHVLGFILWVGSLLGLTLVLQAHQRASGPHEGLIGAERSIARAMELGAMLTIVCGALMILFSPAAVSPIRQPYVHMKLTLVVVIIALHGLVRAKMAKLGRGEGKAPPSWVNGLILLVAIGAIALAILKPLLRTV